VTRHYADWLSAFLDYAKHTEAPKRMHFWAGVSAIAGALRRKVWIDQAYFRWYPNLYIVFVAPPGIVSKTTTVNTAINLLRKVPGVKFGPDVVTWQSLVTSFAGASELFEYQEQWHAMSALTLESGEFGNLLDPRDKAMVDLLVSLWDGKQGAFKKETKMSGNDVVENPWINLIACTTPSWIAGNFPEYMIGGGFTSRCVFVYADKKEKYVAYPGRHVPTDLAEREQKLVEDLESISMSIVGEYKLTDGAYDYGEAWYKHHYENRPINLSDERFGGYMARKQTMLHKVAMILAASEGNNLVITETHLATAQQMLTDLEPDLQFVFNKIGKSDTSTHIDRLVAFIEAQGEIAFSLAYKAVHSYFPSLREFQDVLDGCIKAGMIGLKQKDGTVYLYAKKAADS
jgi:Protein of unknown function (DUF3987)